MGHHTRKLITGIRVCSRWHWPKRSYMLLFTGVSKLLSRRQITGSRRNFSYALLFLGWLVLIPVLTASVYLSYKDIFASNTS